jgi:hypothetical protein
MSIVASSASDAKIRLRVLDAVINVILVVVSVMPHIVLGAAVKVAGPIGRLDFFRALFNFK